MHPAFIALAVLGTPLAALALVTPAFGSGSPTPEDESQTPVRPQEGDPAAPLRLNDQDGKAVVVGGDHSAESSDWTVVAFFPKAATPG